MMEGVYIQDASTVHIEQHLRRPLLLAPSHFLPLIVLTAKAATILTFTDLLGHTDICLTPSFSVVRQPYSFVPKPST